VPEERRRAGGAAVDFPRPPLGAGRCRPAAGTSLLETLIALTLLSVLAMYGTSTMVRWRQQQRLEGALRHLALEVTRTCALAVASGRIHGLRFVSAGGELRWMTLVDGDGDGIRQADYAAGIDVPLESEVVLGARHTGIEPGRPAGAPTLLGGAVDRGGLAFGPANLVSCTPSGGARSGTLYLRSRQGDGAALRLYGPTARMSSWWWDRAMRAWRRAG